MDTLAKYQISTIKGVIIKKGELISGKNTIDIENLIEGLYFIKVHNSYSETTQKLIIN